MYNNNIIIVLGYFNCIFCTQDSSFIQVPFKLRWGRGIPQYKFICYFIFICNNIHLWLGAFWDEGGGSHSRNSSVVAFLYPIFIFRSNKWDCCYIYSHACDCIDLHFLVVLFFCMTFWLNTLSSPWVVLWDTSCCLCVQCYSMQASFCTRYPGAHQTPKL